MDKVAAKKLQGAINALMAYGYVFDESSEFRAPRYVRKGKRTQEWEPRVDGGFLRFDPDGPVPYKITVDEPGISFTEAANAKYFEWVWPDAEVARIYGG